MDEEIDIRVQTVVGEPQGTTDGALLKSDGNETAHCVARLAEDEAERPQTTPTRTSCSTHTKTQSIYVCIVLGVLGITVCSAVAALQLARLNEERHLRAMNYKPNRTPHTVPVLPAAADQMRVQGLYERRLGEVRCDVHPYWMQGDLNGSDMTKREVQILAQDPDVQAIIEQWKSFHGRLFDEIRPVADTCPKDTKLSLTFCINADGAIEEVYGNRALGWKDDDGEFSKALAAKIRALSGKPYMRLPGDCPSIQVWIYLDEKEDKLSLESDFRLSDYYHYPRRH